MVLREHAAPVTEVMAATFIAKNGKHPSGVCTLSILADRDIYLASLARAERMVPNHEQLETARKALNIHHGIED